MRKANSGIRKNPKISRKHFWRDGLLAAGIFLLTCVICSLLLLLDNSASYAPMVFILSVFMISRFTDGYLWGILASLAGVLGVNYFFTFPFFHFNFTLAGYPLTMLSMLAVSLTTSALTTSVKRSERNRFDAEREKTRSNLLRAVSHDLRTPLTSILGATSAVIENDAVLSSEERISLLRGAQEDARWLIRMVENLLAITRVDAEDGGRIVKMPEPAEEVVGEAVAKFKKQFPDVRVCVQVPDELVMVPMDSVLIGQVLKNLLENAVMHGETTSCVSVSVRHEENRAVFEVRDNGVGIDREKLPHIFEGRMLESSETRGNGKRSMGIGLSVCQTIVRAHGGTLCARNAPEGGAVFTFSLQIMEEPYEK